MTDIKRTLAGLPFLVAALGVVFIVLLRGAVPFPLVNDHAYFLPASWWFAEGGRLANPWMQPGFDQTFNWHGFLQPWLVGELARVGGGGWTGVYFAIDLLAALTIVTVAVAARVLGVSPLRSTGLVLVAIALMLDARSRPEVLATLETVIVILLACDLITRFPVSRWHAAAIGALCAALGLTHPVVAVFVCLAVATMLVVLFFEHHAPLRTVFGLSATMGVACALTLLVLFVVVFDGRVAVWLDGMAWAGKITLARTDTDGFLRYYLANRFLPGFALVLIPAGLTVWALLRPSDSSRAAFARWLLLVLIGAAFAYLLYRFALRIPATYYNVTGLLVAICLVATIAPLTRRARLLSDAILGVLATGALAGILLWGVQTVEERPLVAPSRAELATSLLADHTVGRRLCADTAAIAALDTPATARAVTIALRLADAPAPPDPSTCDVFYALQSQSAKEPPTPVPGFALERVVYHPSLLAKIGLRPSHFGFARWISDQTK